MVRGVMADHDRFAVSDADFRVPAVDGLRAAAALAIVVFHGWLLVAIPGSGPVSSLVVGGNYAVDAFFVISGFVLFLPAVRNGSLGNIASYARRRAARIAPAYYFALAFALLFWSASSIPEGAHPLTTTSGWAALLLHLGFAQTLFIGPLSYYLFDVPWTVGFAVIGTVWTLTVEASFYVVLPLVARWYRAHPWRGLAIALSLSVAWRVGFYTIADPVAPATVAEFNGGNVLASQWLISLPGFAGEFAAGMTVAFLFEKWRRRPQLPIRPSLLVAVGAIGFLAVTWYSGYQLAVTGVDVRKNAFLYLAANLLAGITFSVAMLGIILRPSRLSAALGGRVALWLAARSYGIYLWHFPIIMLVRHQLPTKNEPPIPEVLALLAVVVPLTLLAATLSWRFIERPAIRWAARRSSTDLPAPIATTSDVGRLA